MLQGEAANPTCGAPSPWEACGFRPPWWRGSGWATQGLRFQDCPATNPPCLVGSFLIVLEAH